MPLQWKLWVWTTGLPWSNPQKQNQWVLTIQNVKLNCNRKQKIKPSIRVWSGKQNQWVLTICNKGFITGIKSYKLWKLVENSMRLKFLEISKASNRGSGGEVRHKLERTKANHKPYLFLTLSFYYSHSDVYNVVASLVAHLVKNPPAMQETQVWFLSWEDPWRRERLPILVFWPGEFHGLYRPWGCKESDMTFTFTFHIMICWTILK